MSNWDDKTPNKVEFKADGRLLIDGDEFGYLVESNPTVDVLLEDNPDDPGYGAYVVRIGLYAKNVEIEGGGYSDQVTMVETESLRNMRALRADYPS